MKRIGRIVFGMLGVLFVLPVSAAVLCSFMEQGKLSLHGYRDLLFDCFVFYQMFWNSMLYASVGTFLQLVIVILCAFGLTQASFKGKRLVFLAYVVFMMMPLQVTLLPNYIGLRDLGLLNTRWGILLPSAFSSFGVVVMHQYMKGIDGEVIEAMRLESSSVLRIICCGVVPQMKVCIFAVALFVFAENWNMLEQPMLFLKENRLQPLSVLIANAGEYSRNVLFPAAVLFMVPVLLVYLFFKDSLEEGLVFGERF